MENAYSVPITNASRPKVIHTRTKFLLRLAFLGVGLDTIEYDVRRKPISHIAASGM